MSLLRHKTILLVYVSDNIISIMNVGFLIPIVCFWHTITTEVSKYKQDAPTNNIVSFIHCITFILHYNYEYNLEYATHISIGFYIYDLLYIFSRIYRSSANHEAKNEFKKRTPFIIHHLAGMYVLNASLSGEGQEHILYAYNILEKSNIMIYISYHLHKEYAHYLRLNILSEFAQLLIYSYYRLFQLSLYIYDNQIQFFRFQYITQFLIIALYCMGYAWSYNLIQKNRTNFYAVKPRNND
jgi:hypothetical protein